MTFEKGESSEIGLKLSTEWLKPDLHIWMNFAILSSLGEMR